MIGAADPSDEEDKVSQAAIAGSGGDGRVIGLVSTGHFFSHFYMLVLPPLFPLLKAEFDVSYAALGSILAAFSIASGAAQLPMGILVDRLGARYVLIGGTALLAGSVALMGLAPSYFWLVGLAFMAGLGNSVFHPADYTILGATVHPGRMGRAFAIHTFAGHVGWVAAPPTIVFLIAITEWRSALAVVGCLGLGAAALLLAQRHRLDGGGDARRHAEEAAAGGAGRSLGLQVLFTVPIALLFGFFTVTAAIQLGIQSFSATALVSLRGLELVSANAALTGFLVGGAAGVLAGGFVADRVRRFEMVAVVGYCVAALFVSVVALVAMPLAALIGVFAFAGFMIGMVAPSRDMMVRTLSPPGASGKVFGFVSAGLDVGAAVSPVLFGWILDLGRPDGVFLAAAALMIASMIAALITGRFGRPAPVPAG